MRTSMRSSRIRHIGILVLKAADALLYLANVVAHVIDCAANMTQMLKNDMSTSAMVSDYHGIESL